MRAAKFITLLFMTGTLSITAGCGALDAFGGIFGGNTPMMSVDEEELSIAESHVLAAAQIRQMEAEYGADILSSEDTTLLYNSKDAIASQIQRTFLLSSIARSEGAVLSESELASLDSSAQSYLDQMTEEETKKNNFELEDVKGAMEEYILAARYESAMSKISGIPVDEEQMRVIRGKQIVLYFSDDSEKAEAKNLMNQIIEQRQNGISFTALAARYSETDEINVQFSRGYYDDSDFDSAVFSLEEGQTSEILERTSDNSLVLFICLDQNVEEMTQKNIDAYIADQTESIIDSALKDFTASHEVVWNSDSWKSLSISGDSCHSSADFYALTQEFLD